MSIMDLNNDENFPSGQVHTIETLPQQVAQVVINSRPILEVGSARSSPGNWDSSTFLSHSTSSYFTEAELILSPASKRERENLSLSSQNSSSGKLNAIMPKSMTKLTSFSRSHDESSLRAAAEVLEKEKQLGKEVQFVGDSVDRMYEDINLRMSQDEFPTYTSNPWSLVPSNSSFHCLWTTDGELSDFPSNSCNFRLAKEVDLKEWHVSPINNDLKETYIEPSKKIFDHLTYACKVHFKHYYRDYVTHPCLLHPIHVGDAVCVEGDRGEDIGHVTHVSMISKELPLGRLGFILRHATPEEKYLLPIKAKEEWSALEVCRKQAARHQMHIKILDTEYRFDRSFLTCFYSCNRHVDVQDLKQELINVFKTEVCMELVSISSAGVFDSVGTPTPKLEEDFFPQKKEIAAIFRTASVVLK